MYMEKWLDVLVNQFMQQHHLKIDDLYNYLVERKAREKMIPLNKENLEQIKVGMYWYDDDTVSETFYQVRKLKSLVIAVYEDYVIGDTFFENGLLDFNVGMCEIGRFKNAYIPTGHAHKAQLRDIESVCNNIDVINQALRAIDKPQWRFTYWTNSVNKYEDDFVRKDWHYKVDVEQNRHCRTAPDYEKACVRPLLKFDLK